MRRNAASHRYGVTQRAIADDRAACHLEIDESTRRRCKIPAVRRFRQSHFVDTRIYPRLYFVVPDGTSFGRRTRQCPGGVAQLGERLNGIQEVRGSIPLASIAVAEQCGLGRMQLRDAERCRYRLTACGNSSVGRAQPCQGWGRGFESRFPLSQWQLDAAWHVSARRAVSSVG